MKPSHSQVIRLIAVFKLVKAAALIAVGIGAFKLIHADAGRVLEHWVNVLSIEPDSRIVNRAMERIANIPPRRFRELGIGSFVYAGLFLVEGIGLWRLKLWAEWFTVIITFSLVPLEVYEIARHPSLMKVLVLLINLSVVAYLVNRIRKVRR